MAFHEILIYFKTFYFSLFHFILSVAPPSFPIVSPSLVLISSRVYFMNGDSHFVDIASQSIPMIDNVNKLVTKFAYLTPAVAEILWNRYGAPSWSL